MTHYNKKHSWAINDCTLITYMKLLNNIIVVTLLCQFFIDMNIININKINFYWCINKKIANFIHYKSRNINF